MSRKGSQYAQRKCSFQVPVAQGMDNDPEAMLDNTNTDEVMLDNTNTDNDAGQHEHVWGDAGQHEHVWGDAGQHEHGQRGVDSEQQQTPQQQ